MADGFDWGGALNGAWNWITDNPELIAAGLGALAGSQSGGGSPATTTTSNVAPWQLPHIQQALQAAQQQFQQGPQMPYPNSGVAPLSQVTLNAIGNIASQSNAQPYQQIRDYFMGQTQANVKAQKGGMGNYEPAKQALQTASSAPIAQQAGVSDFGLLNAANNAANLQAQTATAADSGEQGYINDVLSGQYLNANPYVDAMFNQAAGGVRANIDSQFASGGRLNSGAAQRALASGLGDLATNIYGTNYANERAQMTNAANLAGSRSGQQNTVNLANAGAQNQMAQFGFGAQLDALQNLGQRQDSVNALNTVQQNNINEARNSQALNFWDQLARSQTQNNQFNAQQGNAMRQFNARLQMEAAQNALGAQQSLMGLYGAQQAAGNTLDQYGQAVLNDQINRYNQTQQAPWNNIFNYLGAASGNWGSSSTTNQPVNQTANVLGGMATGLGLYGQLFGNRQQAGAPQSTITPNGGWGF